MSENVKLYVYDLSNGMARQLSQQLTGRQIDGIWHTSIVVFGKEIFYGQGVNITAPGRSHHGSPMQIVDLGETAIDEETFNEYLDEMREHYTADKYHLLEFNCNSFTNDCAGFLTGGSIPSYIKDLPTDFLSTPFGAALRPTIDAMYRRPAPGVIPAPPTVPASNATPNPELTASILQAVASQAQASQSQPGAANNPLQATESLTGSLHPCTNSASFHNLIRTHRAVVANFSDVATCPPCRVIAPIYEQLAAEKGIQVHAGGRRVGAVFTKIDMGAGHGKSVAAEWGVRVMPTFMFFLDGKKISEMKGADANELRTQVDLLIFQAYPPHPHSSLSLTSIQALSFNPILFTQVPNIDAVSKKLTSFIDSATWPQGAPLPQDQVKQGLTTTVTPYLKSRTQPSTGTANGKTTLPSATPSILATWAQLTVTLSQALPLESLFPIADMWRVAFLDPAVGTWSATNASSTSDPLTVLLSKALTNLQTSPRNYTLILLRLLSNAFSSRVLALRFFSEPGKSNMTTLLVSSLLHQDATVRTAAASLAFNVSAVLQKARVEKMRDGGSGELAEDEDWEVEMVSAIVEAVDREKESEEVVHRLTASLGFLLRLSPFHETALVPLLEALDARKVLKSKLEKGGCGEKGIEKKEVRRLVEEVAMKLCP